MADETKRRISAAKKGKPKSAEHRAKLSAARKGRPNPEHGDKLRGRHHTPEHCEKIRQSHVGSKHTPETRAKMSAAHKGRIVTWGHKISAGKKGVPWSAKRRALFEAKKRPVTEESVALPLTGD